MQKSPKHTFSPSGGGGTVGAATVGAGVGSAVGAGVGAAGASVIVSTSPAGGASAVSTPSITRRTAPA